MKNFYYLCLVLSGVFLASCRPDLEPADWEVDALTPILKSRLDLRDITDLDSSLQSDGDGLLQLVFSEKLASLKPGEIAPPFNEEFENTAKLQNIALGTRVIENQISLGAVALQMGLQGALLVAANGTQQVIPPISGVGPSTFNIDATEFFQSMTLRDGWLVLEVSNNFPIELTNLQYSIQNVNAGSYLLQNTIASLPSGTTHYDSIRLTNNFLIEGNLEATLINLDSPGSNGNSVLVDTSDAIDLKVTLDKLDPVSATAVFPAQDLFNETAEAFIYPPSALLTSVHVAEGEIYMDAYSTINDSINLSYVLPEAVNPNGDILQFLRVIPAAPNGQVVNEYVTIPVQDYDLQLQGMPGSSNIHNTFYTTFIGSIDSTGRIINLSLQDSVFVKTGIKDLIADRGYGFLGYDTIYGDDTVAIQSFRDLVEGNIELDDVQLSLEIENYIGAPFGFKIQNLISKFEDEQQALSWNQLGFEFSIPRAQETSPGAKPNPGRLNINLDKNTSNIQDLLELFPNTLDYDVEAYMNAGEANNDFSQFLYTDYGIEANLNATVPMHVALDSLSLRDTSTFSYIDIDPDWRMKGGDLILKANNNFPFECRVDIILMDNGQVVMDTLKSSEWLAAAPVDNDQRSIGSKESILKFAIKGDKLWALQNTGYMVFKTTFRTEPQSGLVKIYSDNYLDLQLIADFRLSTDKGG